MTFIFCQHFLTLKIKIFYLEKKEFRGLLFTLKELRLLNSSPSIQPLFEILNSPSKMSSNVLCLERVKECVSRAFSRVKSDFRVSFSRFPHWCYSARRKPENRHAQRGPINHSTWIKARGE